MNDKAIRKSRAWTLPWETPEGWICMVGYLAVVLIGMAIPDDVQDRWPAVRSFTEFMAAWNPQINFIGGMPIVGAKANQFLYAILWCVMPIYWAMLARTMYLKKKTDGFMFTFESREKLIALLGGGGLLLFVILHPQGDINSRLGQLLFGFKLTRSLAAPWLVFLAGFLLIPILSFLVALLSGRIRYEAKRKQK